MPRFDSRRRSFAAVPLALLAALAPLLSGCGQEERSAEAFTAEETAETSEEVDAVASAPPPAAPAALAARAAGGPAASPFGAIDTPYEESEGYGRVTILPVPADGDEDFFDDPSAGPASGAGLGGGGGLGGGDAGGVLFDESGSMSGLFADAEPAPVPDPAFTPERPKSAEDFNTEEYDRIVENRFLSAQDTPLSTFAVDVDTASYANVRRFLTRGALPPPGAVRIEELVNYFRYEDSPPASDGDRPFAVKAEVAACPWAPDHRLVRVALKGREIETDARPRCNLVFLLDVSGSMDSPEKLGLVRRAMQLLVGQLGENDLVSIVVYAGASGLALPPTRGDDPRAIMDALDRLAAGGSTNGGAGIQLAYATAVEHFVEGGANRVILCTDGDFNVGDVDRSTLVRMIEEKAQAGVALSVLGFGTGNYQDATMEQLADHGDGNYGYIDDLREARKLLVEQLSGTLVTIAKDVKIQVEFNPAAVSSYRLIGYENRLMDAEDFRDDAKDAGEIGAGHAVTALYEVVPVGAGGAGPDAGELKYQTPGEPTAAASDSGELLTVSLRYKGPDATKTDPAAEFAVPVPDGMTTFDEASADLRFAAAVASFGMLLRGSEHAGSAKFGDAAAWAGAATGSDPGGYRAEFAELARTAARLGD